MMATEPIWRQKEEGGSRCLPAGLSVGPLATLEQNYSCCFGGGGGGGDDNKVSRNTLSLRSPAPACSRYLSGTSETQPPKQILSPCMSVAALLAGTQTHNEWLLKTPYPLFPFGECASVVSERSSTCSRPSLGGFLFTGVVSH